MIKSRNGKLKKLAIQRSFSYFFFNSFFWVERLYVNVNVQQPFTLCGFGIFERSSWSIFLVISLAGFECNWCRRYVFGIWSFDESYSSFGGLLNNQSVSMEIGFLLYHPLNAWHCNSLKEFIQAGEFLEALFFSIHQQDPRCWTKIQGGVLILVISSHRTKLHHFPWRWWIFRFAQRFGGT